MAKATKGDKMAATTNIVTVNVRVEFNLDEVALQDVVAAIDEIQQAAINYGKFEGSLTSRLPLQIDFNY